jgi:hypothetical protein
VDLTQRRLDVTEAALQEGQEPLLKPAAGWQVHPSIVAEPAGVYSYRKPTKEAASASASADELRMLISESSMTTGLHFLELKSLSSGADSNAQGWQDVSVGVICADAGLKNDSPPPAPALAPAPAPGPGPVFQLNHAAWRPRLV